MEEEFQLTTADGVRLEGTAWPVKQPRVVLPWLHGFAEHRKRYRHFATWMAGEGVAVASFDFRGHGASEGPRGHISSFQDYLQDVRAFLNWVVQKYSDAPIILGAHSNGGLIATRFLQEMGSQFKLRGAVLTGPFFAVATPPPGWKIGLARMLASIAPKLSVPTNIPPQAVSHNREIVKEYATDPLVFKTATTRWIVETGINQQIALDRASEIRLPLLVMQGLADPVVSPDAARRFFDNAGSQDKEWVGYDGLFHEILNENERETVYRRMLEWIGKHL